MRRVYEPKTFSVMTQSVIDTANSIIEEYAAQGFELTLRQLYYQFVARDLLENTERSYKRLGSIISNGRLAGEIDWHAIVDRTRFLSGVPHEKSPSSALERLAESYSIDKWAEQSVRPEVWVEKEALAGVVSNACVPLDVDFFSCRGYVSQSAQWRAGRRIRARAQRGQATVVIHLGDHDPSGIDMTRDIRERLELFAEVPVPVRRIALTYEQVLEYEPPPNPAKLTDSRASGYVSEYGLDSWELDALEPSMLVALIKREVLQYQDGTLWNDACGREEAERDRLRKAAREIAREADAR